MVQYRTFVTAPSSTLPTFLLASFNLLNPCCSTTVRARPLPPHHLHHAPLSSPFTSSSASSFSPPSSHSATKNSSPIRLSPLSPISPKQSPLATRAAVHADTFFGDAGTTWTSLDLSQEVADALVQAQLLRPSAVQDVSIPPILTDSDVIVAAETGSGKTQAYLVPLFHKLLLRKKQEAESQPSAQHFALVLCPNAMLCEQVAEMAKALRDGIGSPLLKVSVVSGGQGWPIAPPDLVVGTPAALLNNLFAYDPRRRRRNAFVRDVKYVVFDEADMLLSGGFENQVMRLLNMFRLEEKQLSKLRSLQETATLESPEAGTMDARPWTEFEFAEPALEDGACAEDMEESFDSGVDEEQDQLSDSDEEGGSQPEPRPKRDWIRSRKVYTRSKQYIFAAATLPENGRKTPGAVLKRLLPDAKWVNGLFLHRHNPRLQEHWIEVDEKTQVEALLKVLGDEFRSNVGGSPKKALVFANSVDAVDAICKILRRAGLECLCYHRDVPAEERARSLKDFQAEGGVLVCTDSAARGLDISNISHVIQAEFAKSAVEFLHRVGRTARAGQSGTVTSLYTKVNKPLVEAVRQAKDAGLPVEGAFSRKRSFRNKIKKAELSVHR